MAESFTLSVVTPYKNLYNNIEVDEVVIPGGLGEMDVFPGHAPTMTTLKEGLLKFRPKGTKEYKSVVISWGYCEIFPTGINVLADTAEDPKEIDKERAQEALKKAQQRLKDSGKLPIEEAEKLRRKARRAQIRIDSSLH